MTADLFLLHINAAVYAAIAMRLLLFSRNGSQHKLLGAVLAYILIVASASVTFRVLIGVYHSADISETIINVFFMVLVMRAKGNVMQLFRGASR
ncbi:phage holin family protein [Edwardsiella tarda]|uniref:phage holin family protein n=1 Tax=Edwardsiella tarda TaxID=636 RepID=UPI000D51BBA8|nr:phage holin family protein [Edwardsiella tarda]UCQ18723.1 phage holin family protein [Edwardsiella tarda]